MQDQQHDNSFPGSRLGSACIALAFFAYCLVMQAISGAWQADFAMYPDEPSHFVGSVMVRDWLSDGEWTAPHRFARDYYEQYPYFALGYWPPAFSGITGFVMLLAGVGRMQALLVPAAAAACSAWLIFGCLRARAGPVLAACAGAIYLGLPPVQSWFSAVMVDHLTACLSLAAAVCLIRYLDRPSYGNGALTALVSAAAILSKYSSAYLIGLPIGAALVLHRWDLLRKPSFVMQPLIVAGLAGPWVWWTREFMFYGLPAERPSLTLARAASFVGETFAIFPLPLLLPVAAGLALLVSRKIWRTDLAVFALLFLGDLGFLFFSPVAPEERYVLAAAAVLVILAFAGWARMADRLRAAHRRAAVAAVVVLTGVFVGAYAGRYDRPPAFHLRSIAAAILRQPAWSGQRIVVPADVEGPFIAEFAAQDRARTVGKLLRPVKILARSDWNAERYTSYFDTPEQMLAYFQENPVRLIVWHDRPAHQQRPHERVLGEMLRKYPEHWSNVLAVEPGWMVYEPARLESH